jgi:hypothetical protein
MACMDRKKSDCPLSRYLLGILNFKLLVLLKIHSSYVASNAAQKTMILSIFRKSPFSC